MPYCIYLRKSRTDDEAEQRGEGETLARHEKTLIELAKTQKLNVTQIYKEVVSGETIAARPMVQKLLSEVEKCIWDGVIVMEVERLARGDTVDQGIMAQTFKYSDTKIITPVKTYHPNDEFDEEYFEFGLFMSRREYKTINRRLQRGRIASVKEGKYVANQPPYGYLRKRIENDKGFTLEPHPDQAEVIKTIFEWYTKGELQTSGIYKRLGVSLIVRRLNTLGIKPQKGDAWVPASIRDILINPVYIGKIRWNWRPCVKQMTEGKITKSRPRSKDLILVEGLHNGIIEEETFNTAQTYRKENISLPIGDRNTVKNPLAGLVVCGKCGRKMIRRPKGPRSNADTIMCPATACDNVSVSLPILEDKILKYLDGWLAEYKLIWERESVESMDNSSIHLLQKTFDKNKDEITTLIAQKINTYDLLERRIYTTEIFLERNKLLENQINCLNSKNETILKNLSSKSVIEKTKNRFIPEAEQLQTVYQQLETAEAKNNLLREVLFHIVYLKSTKGRWHSSPDNFEIELFPIVPKH